MTMSRAAAKEIPAESFRGRRSLNVAFLGYRRPAAPVRAGVYRGRMRLEPPVRGARIGASAGSGMEGRALQNDETQGTES